MRANRAYSIAWLNASGRSLQQRLVPLATWCVRRLRTAEYRYRWLKRAGCAGLGMKQKALGLKKPWRRVSRLDCASAAVRKNIRHVMVLLDLYTGLRALDEITVATTTDDILNLIFSSFCIGK